MNQNGLADLVDFFNFKKLRFCNNTGSTYCQQSNASQNSLSDSAVERREEKYTGIKQPTWFAVYVKLCNHNYDR